MPDIGSPAPDFTLLDTARQKRSLSEFRGKNTVLAFYPGAFTGVCDNEFCALRDAMAEFNDLNAQVVGVSVDSPFANAAFASRHGLEFPLLSDFTRGTINTYGILLENFAGIEGYNVAQRSVFVLDADGVIRWSWVAASPGIEPDYAAVKQAVQAL
jgi:glutaredoxin-dependent peroxiredoxin